MTGGWLEMPAGRRVYSTKERKPWLKGPVKSWLYPASCLIIICLPDTETVLITKDRKIVGMAGSKEEAMKLCRSRGWHCYAVLLNDLGKGFWKK